MTDNLEDNVFTDREYVVKLDWDSEAEVWIATSDEIQGLILEAESVDKIIQKTVKAVPELIQLNGLKKKDDVCFVFSRHERVTFF